MSAASGCCAPTTIPSSGSSVVSAEPSTTRFSALAAKIIRLPLLAERTNTTSAPQERQWSLTIHAPPRGDRATRRGRHGPRGCTRADGRRSTPTRRPPSGPRGGCTSCGAGQRPVAGGSACACTAGTAMARGSGPRAPCTAGSAVCSLAITVLASAATGRPAGAYLGRGAISPIRHAIDDVWPVVGRITGDLRARRMPPRARPPHSLVAVERLASGDQAVQVRLAARVAWPTLPLGRVGAERAVLARCRARDGDGLGGRLLVEVVDRLPAGASLRPEHGRAHAAHALADIGQVDGRLAESADVHPGLLLVRVCWMADQSLGFHR